MAPKWAASWGPDSSRFGLLLHSFQWLAYNALNITMAPLVVGMALGLKEAELVDFLQRTILICAAGSLLQLGLGHRLPICENPSGIWVSVFIMLGALTSQTGGSLELLRAQLELGVMLAGLVLALLGLTGLLGRVLTIFTPAVTGTVLILTALQLSGALVKGMAGIQDHYAGFDPRAVLVSLIVVSIIIGCSLKTSGPLKGVSVLAGTAAGWIVASWLGISESNVIPSLSVIRFPGAFPWGFPRFDLGITAVSLLTALLVIPSFMTGVAAMQQSLGVAVKRAQYDSGLSVTGIMNIIAGIYGTFGFYATVSSAGLVNLTGSKRKGSFLIFAIMLLVLGCFVPVVRFLSAMPVPVRHAVMLVSFVQLLGFGLKDLLREPVDNRQVFVIGIPVLISAGINGLPAQALNSIPEYARLVVGNGFLMGMSLCVLLEHVLIPKPGLQ
jgi:xanthine/uracil permease